jgi:hypothetical protein
MNAFSPIFEVVSNSRENSGIGVAVGVVAVAVDVINVDVAGTVVLVGTLVVDEPQAAKSNESDTATKSSERTVFVILFILKYY